MKTLHKQRKLFFLISSILILFLSATLVSCGRKNEQQDDKINGYISDEDFSKLEHIEKIIMEDFEGNESQYYAYVPIGNSGCNERFVSYFDNGLTYMAYLFSDAGSTSFLYSFFEENVDTYLKVWKDSESEYFNIQIGKIQKNGDDRYQIISAQNKDYNGITYEVKKIFYLDILDAGVGILWDLEISEFNMNSETPLIVEELAKCYGIDPEYLQVNGEWAANDMEHYVNKQDVYVPAVGDNILEKVDGYQYMGITTLLGRYNDEGIECPVMIPMGWRTRANDTRVSYFSHGVSISGSMCNESDADSLIDREFKIMMDYYRKVWKGDVITLSEYNNEAYYVVFTYEKESNYSTGYVPEVGVRCFIRFNEEYFLRYEVNLSPEEYDSSTNAVLKELETAYGFDLSEYYY